MLSLKKWSSKKVFSTIALSKSKESPKEQKMDKKMWVKENKIEKKEYKTVKTVKKGWKKC